MTTPSRPQKRSRSARLVLMGLAPFALVSCGGPTQEALVYRDADECSAGRIATPDRCRAGYHAALQASEARAPRYSRRADCVADFGESRCRGEGGGGYYLAHMSGYVMPRSPDLANTQAQPLYRGRSGEFLTAGGHALADRTGPARVHPQALQPQRGVTLARSGFGARAATRGSWGG
jgi:uncharacterized protein YgiB involved in biofilm formation